LFIIERILIFLCQVKTGRIILSLVSVLLSVVFLAGSTGITLIMHNCPSCGDFSVMSGIFLPPAEPEDNCCESADNHCSADISDQSDTFENTSCHFKIEKIKFSNYTPSPKFSVSPIADILPAGFTLNNYSPVSIIKNTLPVHNKHGGRSIITYNCQYLA